MVAVDDEMSIYSQMESASLASVAVLLEPLLNKTGISLAKHSCPFLFYSFLNSLAVRL